MISGQVEIVSTNPALPSNDVSSLTVTLSRELTSRERTNFRARITHLNNGAEVVYNLYSGKVMRIGPPDTEVGSYTISGNVVTVSFDQPTSISTFQLTNT